MSLPTAAPPDHSSVAAPLLVRTFGGLSVTVNGARRSGAAAQPRRLAVLALVARAGERGIARGRLLSLLWPDASDDAARRALNQALHALRHDLDADGLFAGVHDLRLDPAVAACDAWRFDDALRGGRLEAAVGHYAGPFLEGFRLPGAPEFERWIDDERAALAHRHSGALEQLARAAAERGAAADAASWWRRRAAVDPLDARVATSLMRSLVAAGDAAGALLHARIYESLVAQELDLPADAAVVALAAEIRAGDHAPARPVPPGDPKPPVPVRGAAVAVLPFVHVGGDAEAAAFGDGLAEELMTALARAGVPVVGRGALGALGTCTTPDVAALAARCGVARVVEGSVRRHGGRARVAVRLLDAATQTTLWAERFDHDLDAAFDAQDAIAARVVARVVARDASRAA